MTEIKMYKGYNITGMEMIVSGERRSAIKVSCYGTYIGLMVPNEYGDYILVEAMGREIGRTKDKFDGAWELLNYATFPIPKLKSIST